MRETTIVILIDALGSALAERHGFHPPSLPHRSRLRTVLGFSQAALASIFTGLAPGGHSLWMMYSFARGKSPFSWLTLVPSSVSSKRLWLRRFMRWKLQHIDRVSGYYSLYDVPRGVLPYLDIPARGDIFAPGGAGDAPTIFDELEKSGTARLIWDYRTNEERSFDELEAAVREKRGAFYLLYTAGLDSDLHRHGSRAPAVGAHLDWYRERIERICDAARSAGPANVYVFGDHGMCDVREHIDVMARVDALGLEIPRDYVPFYDSTMARFETRSPRARGELTALLGGQPSGRLLSDDERIALGVAFSDGRFGDLVFLADPGVIILPSFMGRDAVAGMHGYHPDAEDMYSALFSNAALPAREMSICDMAGLMLPGFGAGSGRGAR